MKLFWRSLVLVTLILVGIVLGRLLDRSPGPVAQNPDPAPTVENIQGLASVTTLRVDVADAIVSELPGKTGSIKTVLIVRGDVTLGVDLSAASFKQVDHDKRSAVLRLPSPTVQSVRLDQDRTKLVGVWEQGLWAITPGGGDADTAAVNRAMRRAQTVVEAAGQDPGIVQRSQLQTEQVLVAFLRNLGWTVRVEWAD
jgi:hypothetical protein